MCNKAFYTTRTQGFTLVELSIVIIIIGFLIAGVSAGQSLINQAKVNALITEFKNHYNGVNSFKARFGYWPGDWPYAGAMYPNCDPLPSNCNGNGDGKVEYSAAATVPDVASEPLRFWQHLSLGGMIKGNFSPVFTANTGYLGNSPIVGQAIPGSIYSSHDGIGSTAWGVSFSTYIGNDIQELHVSGLVPIAGCPECVIPHSDAIAPSDAYWVDNKIDDGLPKTGKVLSFNGKTNIDSWSTLCVSNTDTYSVNNNRGCTLVFEIE